MRLRSILFIISIFLYSNSKCQQIIDSCFLSIKKPGQYEGSDDLANICKCFSNYEASDLVEWDPVNKAWLGRLPNNPTLDLPPPEGPCLSRAVWMGSPGWTPGGEAFGLRLDAYFQEGKTYTYNFTYAADGAYSDYGFAPVIYTNDYPGYFKSVVLDTLPVAQNSWVTNSITFTATASQAKHRWLIIHAYYQSGIVLSSCKQRNVIPRNFFPHDTILCNGETVRLFAPQGNLFEYSWNTGQKTDSIDVNTAGDYSLGIKYYNCEERDTITLIPTDCEVRMEMPNIITPNGDNLNERLIPISYNYVASGKLQIFNRWGNRLFEGDLFSGWNGKTNNTDVPTGVYYYKIVYEDKANKLHQANGTVTIAR